MWKLLEIFYRTINLNKMNTDNRSTNNEIKLSDQEIAKLIEELKFANKRMEVLETDLFKSQTKIKKQDLEIKKLQEINTLNNKVNSHLK